MGICKRGIKMEEDLNKKVNSNEEQINNNTRLIQENKQQISYNTGALEILKAFKSDSNKFYIMWLITFIALISSIIYIICLHRDIDTIETTTTQEIEQDTNDGSNYYIGRDGEING